MNVWSLFSGIGGLDLGLERAGHTVVMQCESDPYRRAVLAARFLGVPCFIDVASLRVEPAPGAEGDGRVAVSDGAGRVHTVAVPGLVAGGFPCQDLSVAGQRRGLAGSRSGLFFDACRVVEAVRPRAVLLENVPGLLSSNGGRDFGVVLGTLADLGYGVAWRTLNSQFFGVPQRRRRLFILGVDVGGRAGAELAGEILAVGTRCPGHSAAGGEARPGDQPGAVSGTLGGRRGFSGDDIDRGGLTSLSGLGSGGPDDNDAQANRIVVDTVRSHPRPGSNSNGLLVFNASGGDRKDLMPRENVANPVTGSNGDPGAITDGVIVRRLMPVECERLQGFPDGWTVVKEPVYGQTRGGQWRCKSGTSDAARYSALGDAVTVPVSEWLGRRMSEEQQLGS